MELKQQWCDNPECFDFKKVGTANIQVFSYAGARYYCTTCRHTWNADKGTAFETLRGSHLEVVEVVAELGERTSLRAAGRLKEHPVNTVLDWLEVTGRHTAAVSAYQIRDLHISYAQVDELWTFVKKNKPTFNRMTRRTMAICGSGVRLHFPVAYGWSAT